MECYKICEEAHSYVVTIYSSKESCCCTAHLLLIGEAKPIEARILLPLTLYTAWLYYFRLVIDSESPSSD